MDATDGKLLARLMQDPLTPMAGLCDVAGLTRNAVRARLARLKAENILQGFCAVPNPALFGKTGVVSVFETPGTTNPPLSAVLAIDEVVSCSVNHDGKFAAICFQDDAAAIPAALVRQLGGPPQRTFVQRAPPLQPPGAVLSSAQWKVMEALVSDPRASHRVLAEATGLSAKVVERHRRTLIEGGYAQVQALLLSGRSNGATLFEIYVQGPAAKEPAAIQRALSPAWIIDRLDEPVGVLLLAQADGVGQAVATLTRARQLAGVEHAELIFANDHAFAAERVRDWCRVARAGHEEKMSRKV